MNINTQGGAVIMGDPSTSRDFIGRDNINVTINSSEHEQTIKEIKALQEELSDITEKKIEFLTFLKDKLFTANEYINKLLQTSPNNSELVELKEQIDELLAKTKNELVNDGDWMFRMRAAAQVRESKGAAARILADS